MKCQLAFLFMAVGYFFAPVHAEQVKYYYTDAQGTVLATTDAQGNILSTADYRPYGLLAMGQPQDGPGYTGHVADSDTDLLYMQQRYYDPETTRFLSVDPAEASPGNVFNIGRYNYANGNPITNRDPDGKQTVPASAYTQNSSLSESDATNQLMDARATGLLSAFCACNAYYQAPQGSGEIQQVSTPIENGVATALVKGAPIAAAAATNFIASRSTTALYRAVSFTEVSQILQTKTFAAAGASAEGKYFALSKAAASQWGSKMEGAGNFSIVKANVNTSQVGQMYSFQNLDNIGPAKFATFPQLQDAKISVVNP